MAELNTTAVQELRTVLGLTEETHEIHARHNLDGALIDICYRGGHADQISQRTIARVIRQLARVEEILERADAKA